MALSLEAVQKSILGIFTGEEIYKIPDYQRPYSWGYDECYELYQDLVNAYNNNDDYFIGNLVLANSISSKYESQVVDGQQRLTTIWLVLKILSLMCSTINPLRSALSVDAREGNDKELRVQPLKDKEDYETLLEIFRMSLGDVKARMQNHLKCGELVFGEKDSKILQSFLNFYNWLSFFESEFGTDKLKSFTNYLLDRVYMLPIALKDNTEEAAVNKALTVFVTLNNRGKDLENADLFKATLYRKALFVGEQIQFRNLWANFTSQCESMQVSVDDVFRYYSHIIRGKKNITQMEIKLLDFFVSQQYSPLQNKEYRDVMDDLFKILDILSFINKNKYNADSEFGKWFQIIDAYSNNYPRTALMVYLFTNGTDDEEGIIRFSKAIIRYAYGFGSTRSVKFGIYSIIADVANRRAYSDNLKDKMESYDYASAGRIKEGFAMIAFYSKYNTQSYINIDKWISGKDFESLGKIDSAWYEEKKLWELNSIGNYVILDVARVNAPFHTRCENYSVSALDDVKNYFKPSISQTYSEFQKRDAMMRERVGDFFKKA